MTAARPRLLDLFCCAGGCSVGYARAGFEVVGVDLVLQPDYPFEFHLANALTFPLDGFDAVHASPPCKAHTTLSALRRGHTQGELFDPHPDLVGPTRDRLVASGLPYVIENVVGAPLVDPVLYCGSSFGLLVRRHRLFESNVPIEAPPCDHKAQPVVLGVYGHGGGFTGSKGKGTTVSGAVAAEALGITHTVDQSRLSQAIPPAYTEHIGRQLIAYLEARP